jgi:C-terminal processing protease CtpA/Prc
LNNGYLSQAAFYFSKVAIDGKDVRGMFVSEVTSLMAARSGQERQLTILSAAQFDDLDEAKEEDFIE